MAPSTKQATWTLNFGPQHPATHTTLRLILELDGERIVKATPDIGYLHSGFEKLGEHLNFNQYVTIVDRKNYISPPMNEVAWHHAVEKLLGIELTPRCQYIRVIISELARISDHLLCTGAAALDLGRSPRFSLRSTCASRSTTSMKRCRATGFIQATPASAASCTTSMTACSIESRRCSTAFPGSTPTWRSCLFRNRIFLDRLRKVGVLSKADAIAYSCTGPIARASGVTCDLRKDEPYLVYPELDFEVPYTDEGRFLGAVHRAHGRDAPEPPDPHAGDQATARRPGQRADRREVPACPTS